MRRVADDDPRWRQSAFGYGCNAAKENRPAASEPCPQKRMTASWSGPHRVQPNTSVVRAIERGQWQAPLGSSHGQPPDRRQPAAVLASVKDEPSAALKKRRP